MSFPKATPQDTDTHFMGSGFDTWGWWDRMHLGRAWKGATLISWSYTGIAGYPEDFDAHVVLNHEAVIRAIRKIANVKVGIKEGEPYSNTLYLSKSVIQECRTWIFKGPNECDFDAGMADEVMQVAAFGIVTYG